MGPLSPHPALALTTQVGSSAWLVVGWVAVAVGVLSAAAIAWDIGVAGYRQQMGVMDLVWPITGLYWGPMALWLYFRRARRMSPKWAAANGVDLEDLMSDEEDDPPTYGAYARKNWWAISKGAAHCGAGCSLGDLLGEWLVYVTAWSIAIFAAEGANSLMAMFVADFVLAWTLGIAFQYFSIVPMREDIGRLEGIWAAIKADTLSIASFQIGMFGWMALFHLVLWQPPLTVASPTYWFMMQVGMICGYLTTWPVNALLVKHGIKEKM